MRAPLVAAALSLVGIMPPSAHAAPLPPKNVLIVRGGSPDLPGGNAVIQSIEDTVRRTSPVPVDFYIESVETARFSASTYEQQLSDLIAVKYADIRLDLVVALSAPSVQFVLRERPILFPRVPVLFGIIDRSMLEPSAVPPGGSAVFVQIDAPGTVRFAQRAYPAARRVLVAGGTSWSDRLWQRVVREQLREIEPQIPIAYDTDSTLEDLARRTATLPPDTIVLYLSMLRDAADRPTQAVQALQTLRASSGVPIFGLSTTFVGQGIVGGIVVDLNRHGADLAQHAIRMLGGDTPPLATTTAAAAADWRELQRFHIAQSMLPPATTLLFREPNLWEEQKGTILTAAVVLLAQTALIVALVRAGNRRRETEAQLLSGLQFERHLSEFAVSAATARASETSRTMDAALGRMAERFGVEWAWRWRPEEDEEWTSPALRLGDPAPYASIDQLPPTIQLRLRNAGVSRCSALAIPMLANGSCLGAIFWIARVGHVWERQVDQMRVVGAVAATVMQRKQVEIALEDSNYLKGAIVESLPAHIAVVDRQGVIISVNEAWRRYAEEHAEHGAAVQGVNFVGLCREAEAAGVAGARAMADLVERACRGETTRVEVEHCHVSPGSERWFTMIAEPLRRQEGGAVVSYSDITARKQHEIALRESEDRFRHMADALPVAIWLSDVTGAFTYFNKQWLEMTGRTREQECGEGWLESIHVADRAGCMDAYVKAFHVRRGFAIEYRLRRYDGEYRWIVDTGVPRYGSDGAFHGYVGGALDITERKEAERMLRGLTHRLMSAQDDERRRIARELHDHLSQQLALLAIDLQQLSGQSPPSVDAFVPALQEAWRRTTEIASDVHAISHRLHPSKMEALGLVATIRAHCREVSRQSLAVQFHEQDVPGGMAPDRALSLFRVVEEALSNVARHSGAKSAHVALGGIDGEHLLLRIADDGCGFKGGREGGLGLISMRERVESLDGTLSITSTPGRGTVVEVRVPVHPVSGGADGSPRTHAARAESA